jgi:thiamine biosynthesis protein ThiS
VEITLNGELRAVPEGTTVAALLASLALSPTTVAVEVDLEIVPRASYAERALAPGAAVEIVTFVGGG